MEAMARFRGDFWKQKSIENSRCMLVVRCRQLYLGYSTSLQAENDYRSLSSVANWKA
jgi:hypothetical protein